MKKAFTMLELIFILVVIGILAAIITPRMERDPVYEAGVRLLADIRYTQHLAMVNDRYDATDPTWFQERWQIMFEKSTDSNDQWAYTIYADASKDGTADVFTEIAVNPEDTSKRLSGGTAGAVFETSRYTSGMNLGHEYGISNIVITSGGAAVANTALLFDNLGRPYNGNALATPTAGLLNNPVFIKICLGACGGDDNASNSDEELVIRVQDETGSPCILQQGSAINCLD